MAATSICMGEAREVAAGGGTVLRVLGMFVLFMLPFAFSSQKKKEKKNRNQQKMRQ